MVNKITNPPSQKELIDKVNEIIDDKQDTLVSGTNIKTVNGTSLLGSGNIDIQSAPNLDNKSITKNTANELQTIGVIDQNNASQAIKTWTGTLAQYNAIATKDNNTLYNITDDMQAVTYEAYSKSETDALISTALNNTLSTLYPVGSIYIGTQSTCPLATLISGSTWVKVSEGRVLQGSDSNHNTGTTIEAGLPNMTGGFKIQGNAGVTWGNSDLILGTGVFKTRLSGSFDNRANQNVAVGQEARTSEQPDYVDFNASRSSSIYGNSNTVQPPAYVVNIWQRTA